MQRGRCARGGARSPPDPGPAQVSAGPWAPALLLEPGLLGLRLWAARPEWLQPRTRGKRGGSRPGLCAPHPLRPARPPACAVRGLPPGGRGGWGGGQWSLRPLTTALASGRLCVLAGPFLRIASRGANRPLLAPLATGAPRTVSLQVGVGRTRRLNGFVCKTGKQTNRGVEPGAGICAFAARTTVTAGI